MTTLVPEFYKDFKCIADKCRHSCCVGWDICIDEDSLRRFQKDGLEHISLDDTPHFILKDDNRCPYLLDNGLCHLIIEKGEDYLCQICTDHPRFRNYWTGITEIGLGMVCEEAARLILTQSEPLKLVFLDGDLEPSSLPEDEKYLWDIRQQLFSQASQITDNMTARLYEYFIFRHIADALYDDRLNERIQFVSYCVNSIVKLWDESEDQSEDALIKIARSFSYEIEYNEENKENLLSSFS